jgi:tRNA (guanine-N7-)-methyltransferase
MTEPTMPVRQLRTFHPRQRKLGPERQARFDATLPLYAVDAHGDVLDLAAVFARPRPDVVVDIGVGGGEGTVAMAAMRPDECILAVEVHTPGVANIVLSADEQGWDHVRVCHGDALELLARIPAASLWGVRIWFPDPWPKAKQHKRRLVQPDVVGALVDRLRMGGWLHLATDHAGYAEQIAAVMAAETRVTGGEIDRPEWRPVTRFERRGVEEGRRPRDYWFERTGDGVTTARSGIDQSPVAGRTNTSDGTSA